MKITIGRKNGRLEHPPNINVDIQREIIIVKRDSDEPKYITFEEIEFLHIES